jgi:hypothetical protein
MIDALLKLGLGTAKMGCEPTLSVPIEAKSFAVAILVSTVVEYGLYPSALSHCTGLWVLRYLFVDQAPMLYSVQTFLHL